VILKALKNELIGHPLKKQTAVATGILDLIARLALNKAVTRNDGKSHDHSFAARPLTEEEKVRLYGLQVIASVSLSEKILFMTGFNINSSTRRSVLFRMSPFCIGSS